MLGPTYLPFVEKVVLYQRSAQDQPLNIYKYHSSNLMLLQLIRSTSYHHGEYTQGLFRFTIMKRGKATKAVIRNEELGTY